MMQIIDDALKSHDLTQFKDWQNKIEEAALVNVEYGELLKRQIDKQKREKFFEIWSRLDSDSKYPILRKHLWEGKSPSDGYIDLANLIKMGYIKMIISTNLDNLLEKALNNAGWYQPNDFIVIVNGKDRPEEVFEQIESSHAPFKLVKLHGTLESPNSYAFTPEEVFDFEKIIKPSLSRIINQSLIILGHSMQDRDIDMLFDDEGKEIHFVKPTRPEPESRIDTILKVRQQGSIIYGDSGNFDNFLQKLWLYIEKESDEIRIQGSVQTIEEFLRSIGYEHELKVPYSRFRNLPSLYVKPTEYNDICSKLEKEHVVFIIGEPHLGKTYTALYLLWDYYQKGYETLHIRHDRLVSLLHQHDGEMKKLLFDLFASEKGLPRIIHFDDPFGETMERRTDAFAKELDNFLDLARGYEHLRIIVTTRLNIFRESMAEVHDRKKIEELEKDIRVHTSYRRDILLDILHRYTHFYNPLWASNEKIISALDKQLPDLLPAPHNVEFFVRTSEKLTSLEEVFNHVEKSKEMIKALGEWMSSLSDHEQLFLMWLEICSTAAILFPDTSASKVDFESAYMETLAYMFKKKYIAGIPPSPLSRAKDKFDMIILESKDKEAGSIRYDFVHPSYHEAFWYAERKSAMHRWWELLMEKAGEILKDLKNRVDIVQLRMIERYGTINRDLDQLLLLSAESDDANEQLIALEHMLEHTDKFANLPQFSHCLYSVISSKNQEHRNDFLNLVEKYYDQLPLDVLRAVPSFVFDNEREVRQKAEEIVLKHFDTLPEPIKQCETVQTWRVLYNLFLPIRKQLALEGEFSDPISLLETFGSQKNQELVNRFVKISPSELQLLLKIKQGSYLKIILDIVNISWKKLSPEHIEIITNNDFLDSDDSVMEAIELLVLHHQDDFAPSTKNYTFIQELNLFQQTFNICIKKDESITLQFKSLSVDDWIQVSPDVLKSLIYSTLPGLSKAVLEKILENYDELSQEQRSLLLTLQSTPTVFKALNKYIRKHKSQFKNLSNDALVYLLSFPGYIQYEALTGLLMRFKRLTKRENLIVNKLINNPPDWWVGGSIGQMTKKGFKTSKELKDLLMRLLNHPNKRVIGALLAEMAQCHYDVNIGLKDVYKAKLYELSRDAKAVRYAEEWMDYEFKSMEFYNKNYWSEVKTHLRNLSKELN